MSDVTAAQAPGLSGEQIDRILQAMAESFAQQPRSPILHSPSEESLDYQEVTFPALDGVPLEGWFPGAFDGVRCLVGPQPVTMKIIVGRRLALAGVPADRIDDLEERIVLRTSIGFARRAPQEWARNVCVPTFLYQVHDDVLTDPSDVQTMFDNIPIADKKLQWLHGTTRRWDGYLEFQRRPEPMLEWFEKHMS